MKDHMETAWISRFHTVFTLSADTGILHANSHVNFMLFANNIKQCFQRRSAAGDGDIRIESWTNLTKCDIAITLTQAHKSAKSWFVWVWHSALEVNIYEPFSTCVFCVCMTYSILPSQYSLSIFLSNENDLSSQSVYFLYITDYMVIISQLPYAFDKS